MHTVYTCYALFLFSPRYQRAHPERVAAWIARCASAMPERDIALARTDMIMAHDELARLGQIDKPTLVLCGNQDACTPPQLSEELAQAIRGAEYVALPGGHLVHDENPVEYFETVSAFLARHGSDSIGAA